jgi:dTDP-4-dehydrorhamnose reductase
VEAVEKMKGVVFGSGFLGTRLSGALGYGLPDINVLETGALNSVLDSMKPDVVINAVGKTGRPNIGWCETHKEETVRGNIMAPVNLALACSDRGIYFVHIGSGGVYNGDNDGRGFSELDAPNFYESQFYAKTKAISEKILGEFPCLQLRIMTPIDDRPHPRNLIDKLLGYKKVIDTQNSMTAVPDMITAAGKLIEARREGIYNLVNPGTISVAEIMNMYREIVNPAHSFDVVSDAELEKSTVCKRANCYLNTDKLKSEGIELSEIHGAVRECLINYRENLRK